MLAERRPTPPTDTQSNGWSTTTEPTSQGGGNAFLCYAEDVAAGNTTVTLDYGTGFYITGEFAEFSGVVVVSPLDQQTSGSSAWSNSPATGTTGTLAQTDELVLAVVGGQASNANEGFDVPATTGYTNLYVEQDGSLHESGSGDYKFVAATTGVSAAWGEPRLRAFRGRRSWPRSSSLLGRVQRLVRSARPIPRSRSAFTCRLDSRSATSRFRGARADGRRPGRRPRAGSSSPAGRAQRSGRPAKLTGAGLHQPASQGHRSATETDRRRRWLFGNRARSARPQRPTPPSLSRCGRRGLSARRRVRHGAGRFAGRRGCGDRAGRGDRHGAGADVCTASRDRAAGRG